tara:strand:+ start:494 stop:763 length:270 start_codon:yes stop_codon:yes gene_type:complete
MPRFDGFEELAQHYAAQARAGESAQIAADELREMVYLETNQPLSSSDYRDIIRMIEQALAPTGVVTISKRDNQYVMELVSLMQALLQEA